MATHHRHLFHPKRDNPAEHLREEPDSRIVALTATGAFHLDRLRLNRAPLVALHRARRDVAQLRQTLADTQAEQAQLRERIATMESALQDVLAQIARLMEE
jgi:cell division protein FtsB